MGKIAKKIIIDLQKVYYVKAGSRRGCVCYKVIEEYNEYSIHDNEHAEYHIDFRKAKTIGVYDNLTDAEKACDAAADAYCDRIEVGDI